MKYHVNTPAQFDRAVGAMRAAHEILGGDTLIWIEKYKHPKTRDQNALLHCLFRELGQLVGYSEKGMKEIMKQEFGPYVTVKVPTTGQPKERWEVKRVCKSVSQYTREETSELIEHCHRIAAENGWLLQGK